MVSASDSAEPGVLARRIPRGLAPVLAPRLARGIVAVVLTGFCLVAFVRLLGFDPSPLEVLLGASCMIALLSLQLFFFNRPVEDLRSPIGYLALLAQAGLVYLPLLVFGQSWVALPGFLGGAIMLVLPIKVAWMGFCMVVASIAAIQASFTGNLLDVMFISTSAIITGLVVYGLTRMSSLVTELHKAQNELAEMAVAQERLRFARDLHDLLGYSLSAITLKSELTHRLMLRHPGRAQEELSEVLDISRRALADVRAVASGYRELSFAAESESARSVLIAADIDVQMDLDYGELPTRVRTVLATVLREGVTNVLRHSKAERCEIVVKQNGDAVTIDIVNDGVPQVPIERAARGGGSGIPNLSVRLAAVGGRLTAGVDQDGRYRLHASAPVSRRR